MISIGAAVQVIVTLMIAGAVFWLLHWLIGYIAPPIFVAWGCAACHTLTTTGEYNGVRLERDDRELALLRGMRRTQAILFREGVIHV